MVQSKKVEVVARGKYWAILADDDGVTHKMLVETGWGKSQMNWVCRGAAKIVDDEELGRRVRDASTSVTCIDCIARELP